MYGKKNDEKSKEIENWNHLALSLRSGEEASTLQYNVPKKKRKDKTTCKKIICPQKLEAQFTSLIGYPPA